MQSARGGIPLRLGAVELVQCWGVAENGESIEVALVPNLVDELERRWPSQSLECRDEPAGEVVARLGLSDTWLCVPDREPSGTNPSQEAWDQLQTELTLFAVKRLARLVPVHSAAIAWNGRVLVVPARPEGGKSTLAIAAHEAGATVLSDEYTLIDPETGLVTGWVRPVRRRNADGTTTLLDLAQPSGPLPVGLIALVSYDGDVDETGPDAEGRAEPGTVTPTWHPISPAEATVEILSHTLTTRSRPDDTFNAVVAITRAAPAIRGTRGEADKAIRRVLAGLDDSDNPDHGRAVNRG